jgi:hypothetical protein
MALDRFDAEWPAVWLVYGEPSVGWKDQYISRVFLRIDGYRHLVGDDRFREYQVRASKQETAIQRAVEWVQSTVQVEITIYRVTLPPSPQRVGFLEAENARIQRDPRWGAFKGPVRSRAVGTAPRAGRNHRNLSRQRRRSLSVGMR